jgi:hypothetical protein
MQIARFALLISCVAGYPICMIPCKDSIEELFFKENKMTFNQNIVITLMLTNFCVLIAMLVPDIGMSMSIVGSTVNPIIGFILPVILYWPQIKDKPILSADKIAAISTVVFMIVISVLSLYNLSSQNSNPNDPSTC